jgi:hypothetical protein
MIRPEYFDVVVDYADEVERMLIGLPPASRAGVGSPSSARPAGVHRSPTPATQTMGLASATSESDPRLALRVGPILIAYDGVARMARHRTNPQRNHHRH